MIHRYTSHLARTVYLVR